MKILLLNIMLTALYSLSFGQDINDCSNKKDCLEITKNIYYQIDSVSCGEIKQFLNCFALDEAKNNAEFSQFGNKVLFLAMEKRPYDFFNELFQLPKEVLDKVVVHIEHPVSDKINIQKVYSNVENVEMLDELKARALKLLEPVLSEYKKNKGIAE